MGSLPQFPSNDKAEPQAASPRWLTALLWLSLGAFFILIIFYWNVPASSIIVGAITLFVYFVWFTDAKGSSSR
jgi:hypothetical protein